MAPEWFDNWHSISARRMERNQWSLSPTYMETGDINSDLPIFPATVERNSDRARRRYLRERAMPFSHADGPIALDSGEIFHVPSGDGPILAERDFP